jgi:hypothetical protein
MSTSSSFLGEQYNYSDNIRPPAGIGFDNNGTFPQLGRNINGFEDYVNLLVSGNSPASVTNAPLGNKYFLETKGTCQAVDNCTTDSSGNQTCQTTTRYLYMNNIPTGGMGTDSVNPQFQGLVPGILEDLTQLNPMGVFDAFLDSSPPKCQQITMETIDNNNNSSTDTQYVTLTDISNMDPCWFTGSQYNGVNPVSNTSCQESFKTNVGVANNAEVIMSDDITEQLYFAGLACVGIYIFYCIMKKAS